MIQYNIIIHQNYIYLSYDRPLPFENKSPITTLQYNWINL
jgi:hypothetical protein